MPTADLRYTAFAFDLNPGQTRTLRCDYDDDLTGRTFEAVLDDIDLAVTVDEDANTVTIIFDGADTEDLSTRLHHTWYLYDTTAGDDPLQIEFGGPVHLSTRGTELPDASVVVTSRDITVAVTVLGEPGPPGSAGSGATAEEIQDTVGLFVADSTTIDATYNDLGNAETLEVKDGSITPTKLSFDPATQTELDAEATARAAADTAEATARANADTALDGRVDALEVAPPNHASRHADGGADELALDGSQITTGTVADARIASTIARDSEVTSAVAAEATARDAAIATHAAAADPHTGYQKESEKGQANGYPSLDGTGKVPTTQLPALAISSTNVVASQAAMLALTAEEGDVAVRTDLNKSFILKSPGDPTVLANWQELLTPTDAVASVDGRTGVVSLSDLYDAAGAADAVEDDAVMDGDAAGGVLSGTFPNPGFAVDMATQAELDAHLNDTADAHDASAVSFSPTGAIAATDVQAAIAELDSEKSPTGHDHSATYASLAGATFTGDIIVPAEAYGAGWNGSNEAPTKNDVYDKIETISGGSGLTQEEVEDLLGNSFLVEGTHVNLTYGDNGAGVGSLTIDAEDTDLGYTAAPTQGTVTSSTGDDATVPLADGTNAGLMAPAQHTKLAGIETGATADQTAAEILTAIKTVDGAGSGLDADLLDGQSSAFYAVDADVVHDTGDETIAGVKTFSSDPLIPDEAYDATAWNGSLEPPTKNAVRDKIEDILDGVTFTGDIVVPDEAYDATAWNGSLEVPTKNAVRDKIEALSVGGSVDVISNVASQRFIARSTAGSGDSEELTPDQSWALLGTGLYVPQIAVVTSDVTHAQSNTTLSDVTGMAFTIGASATEIWFFEIFAQIGSASAAQDLKVGWTFPTSATMRWGIIGQGGSTTIAGFGATAAGADPAAWLVQTDTPAYGTGGTGQTLAWSGWVFGGGTGGSVQFRFAQNTSTAADLKVKAGSLIRYTKLAA